MSRKKNEPEEIVAFWAGSWATRPIGFCALTWCAGALAWRLDVAVWMVVAAAVITALLAPMVATGLDMPRRGAWFHFVLWSAAGAYVSWIVATNPLQRDVFLAWVPGAGLLGAWWWWLRHLAARDRARGVDKQHQAETDADRGEYVYMIERMLKKARNESGIREIARDPFHAGHEYGHTVRLRMPADGTVTYSLLEQNIEKLETIADARRGSLWFERGTTGREVLLHAAGRDALEETRPLEFIRGPKSIKDPIHLGWYADGRVCVVTFREVAAMLVGLRGSGKSSLINTHLAHMTGCVDALVWMIDLKGGRTAYPWIEPFLTGESDRPAIDWLATTGDEAETMLVAAKAAILGRALPPAFLRNGPRRSVKIDPTPEQPAVILIVEEASLVTGVGKTENLARAQLLQDNVNTGRSEAFDAMVCSQRGTVTMLGNGDMTSNLNLRYGMGVTDRQEASMVFADSEFAQLMCSIPSDDEHRGVFLMKGKGKSRKMAAKNAWIDDALIPGYAVSNAQYRADLDDATIGFIETALSQRPGATGSYAERWDRLMTHFGVPSRETAAASHPVSHGPSHPVSHEVSHNSAGETPEERGARLVQEAVEADRRRRETASTETAFEAIVRREVGEDGTWRETPTPIDIPPEERADPDAIPPIIRCLTAIFNARDCDELPTAVILDDLPGELSAKALAELVKPCGFGPVENITGPDGNRARGYRRIDVARAFTRARDSGAPPAAFGWEP